MWQTPTGGSLATCSGTPAGGKSCSVPMPAYRVVKPYFWHPGGMQLHGALAQHMLRAAHRSNASEGFAARAANCASCFRLLSTGFCCSPEPSNSTIAGRSYEVQAGMHRSAPLFFCTRFSPAVPVASCPTSTVESGRFRSRSPVRRGLLYIITNIKNITEYSIL